MPSDGHKQLRDPVPHHAEVQPVATYTVKVTGFAEHTWFLYVGPDLTASGKEETRAKAIAAAMAAAVGCKG